MKRVYNFSAGPSALPEPVLKTAAEEMLCYRDSGMSVMEMSHRSKDYEPIIFGAMDLLREVMEIPENYKILFVQGGASTQFAAVPMNLMTKNKKADYIVTGQFSKKAYQEAKKYGDVNLVYSTEDKNNTYIPQQSDLKFSPDADYVHICFNNTIFGTKWNYIPDTGDVPLVADLSSCILSEPIDVSKFGVIYAGAQKNMAPAGLTVVIIREDLIGEPLEFTPTMLRYDTMANNDSMYNTPPCYTIYMCGLVLQWLKELGGLTKMAEINKNKAKLLYDYLDSSALFNNPVVPECRSMMNATFVTGDKDMDARFCAEAAKAGFVNIKGHRSVGGMRASIYNAMPTEGIVALIEFMKKFEAENK